MHIAVINLFDHNVVWHVPKLDSDVHSYIGINLFDHNMVMVCAKVRLTCSFISLVLIYLITMWVWHVQKLDSDVHSYH